MKAITTIQEEGLLRRKSNVLSAKAAGPNSPANLLNQFISLFDSFGSTIYYRFDNELIKPSVDICSWLKQHLPDSYGIIYEGLEIRATNNRRSSSYLEDDDCSNYHSCLIGDMDRHILISCEGSDICFCYDHGRKEIEQELLQILHNMAEACIETESNKHRLQYIAIEYGSFFLSPMSIQDTPDWNVDLHYNDDFRPISEHIEEFIDSKKSGLVILHGEQGTGKTTYIRHLINTHDCSFVYLPMDMASQLTKPEFVSFIKESLSNSIIILEDCEQLLEDRGQSLSNLNSGLSNILNMADGLLGDALNLRFICTFNSDVRNIDKALLRKGRLIEKYEFKKLTAEKTAALQTELYGQADATVKPMTLAEIFNRDVDNHGAQATRNKVGF